MKLVPWLMRFRRGLHTWQRDAPQEELRTHKLGFQPCCYNRSVLRVTWIERSKVCTPRRKTCGITIVIPEQYKITCTKFTVNFIFRPYFYFVLYSCKSVSIMILNDIEYLWVFKGVINLNQTVLQDFTVYRVHVPLHIFIVRTTKLSFYYNLCIWLQTTVEC